MNENFRRQGRPDAESSFILYKSRNVIFVINYRRNANSPIKDHLRIRLESIKSIYINETPVAIYNYIEPDKLLEGRDELDKYSCVVFIETYPEGSIPAEAGKGVRKTWLEGYSQVKEFYSPDYSVLPHENDYRRTLYWNPSVISDESGKASIQFYNNSRCTNFKISAETITQQGVIGILQ